MALTQTKVSQLYVAIFNRASEGSGNTYWQSAHTNATTTAEAMFLLPSVKTFFGVTNFTDTANVRTVIEAIYLNSLGKAPADDVAGITYWIGQVTGGRSMGDVVSTLVDAAVATANAGAAQNIFNNKVTVSNYAADTLTAHTTDAAFQGYLSGVTAAAGTVTTANAAILAAVPASSNPGTTYTLTTAFETLVGTAADDIFNAGVTGAAGAALTVETLSQLDSITGGAGNDVLNYTAIGATPLLGTVHGVEKINVVTDAALTVSTVTSEITGVTSIVGRTIGGAVDIDTSSDVTSVTITGSAAAVAITDNGTATVADVLSTITVNNSTAALTLQSDALTTLNLSATGNNATVTAAAGTRALTVNLTAMVAEKDVIDATATTVTYNASGATQAVGLTTHQAATTVNTVAAGNVTWEAIETAANATLNMSGAGNQILTGAVDTEIIVLNAAAATGNLTITGGTLVTATTTLGTGNDTYTTGGVLTTGTVNAGAGTDTLVLAANVSHANTTALKAKYTNFEVLSVNGTYNASVFGATLTSVALSGATNNLSGLTAAVAGNIVASADIGATTIALAAATGSADVLSLKFGAAATATAAATNATDLTLTGFETVNIVANGGASATAGANQITTIGSMVGDVKTVNMTGSSFVLTANDLDSAATFNASALTGDSAATNLGLTMGTLTFVGGSVVNGSAFVDNITIDAGTEGVVLNLGAGNDLVGVDFASLVNDGTDDMTINGGAGTDKVTVSDTDAIMTDNHFMNMSGLEALTVSTGVHSITTGGSFNTAFAAGMTLTTGTIANDKALLISAGTATVDMDIVSTTSNDGEEAAHDTTITTGSGDDTITLIAAELVGDIASSTYIFNTGAGIDNVSITGYNMGAEAAINMITIDLGAGADTVTLSGDNGAAANALVMFDIADGDSIVTARDKYTGFEAGDGTNNSSGLNFNGIAVVGNTTTHTDFGTIKSLAIATAGIITFDDAATFAAAIIINENNLSDALGFLRANSTALDVYAFAFDSTGDGANDATMVWSDAITAEADNLVELVGVTGITTLFISSANTDNGIFVQ